MRVGLNSSFCNFGKSNYKNPNKFINTERMTDLFVKAVKIDTASNEDMIDKKSPTTENQLALAKFLAEELKNIGMNNVEIDEKGFLTATLPSNVENAPTVAFLAHLDTSPDCNSGPVHPVFHDYKEGNIKLKGQTIKADELEKYKNHTIITSDGTSLLGADDKAGIAEIIEALRVFTEHPELKRPEIKIAFTPDEEIGAGVNYFDIEKFKADVAYTVDGEGPECIDAETFNAYNPTITIKGVSSHYGHAYQKMVNSIIVANDFINEFPADERPETTKERQGYYCVDRIIGNADETKVKLVVRDFDSEGMQERLNFVIEKVNKIKEKYPEAQITYELNPMYKNMKTYIEKTPEITEYAKMGIKHSGLNPQETIIRGGTDGADLSARGLPCPNIGAGEENFHTLKEFVSVDVMKKCCENIINIAQVWACEKNPFINK